MPISGHSSTANIGNVHNPVRDRDGTEIGLKVKAIMAKGGLVSDEIVLELLLQRSKESSKSLLLDGFPRTLHQ